MGMGNLADELGFADEDGWDDEGLDEGIGHMSMADELDNSQPAQDKDMHTEEHDGQIFQDPPQNDGARDSGIDVEYTSSPAAPPIRNFSYGPFVQSPKIQSTRSQRSRPTSKAGSQEQPDAFSFELEDAMNAVARLADPQHQQQADTIARTVSALQDLAPQVTLESQTQRLTTSTNSLSSNLMRQTKLLASLSSSVFSPFALTAPLDAVDIDEILPTLFEILKDLPLPDARALQGLAKLDRETGDLLRTLAGLQDSLQMGKHTTTSAARHLRTTQAMVTELRRERERAEEAQFWIEKEGWERRLEERWCASECRDVVGGFEQVCEGLRRGLEENVAA